VAELNRVPKGEIELDPIGISTLIKLLILLLPIPILILTVLDIVSLLTCSFAFIGKMAHSSSPTYSFLNSFSLGHGVVYGTILDN